MGKRVILNKEELKFSNRPNFSLDSQMPRSDDGMGGRVGNVARVVEQSRVDQDPLRGTVLGERQHVVVGIVVDECERVHRGAILEHTRVPEALVIPTSASLAGRLLLSCGWLRHNESTRPLDVGCA